MPSSCSNTMELYRRGRRHRRAAEQMAVTGVGQVAATYAVVLRAAHCQLGCVLGSSLNLDQQHPEQHICLCPEPHVLLHGLSLPDGSWCELGALRCTEAQGLFESAAKQGRPMRTNSHVNDIRLPPIDGSSLPPTLDSVPGWPDGANSFRHISWLINSGRQPENHPFR